MRPLDFVADFDSASAMLRATAAALRGEDFPALGVESALEHVAGLINRLPDPLKEQAYIWGGASEAVDPERLGAVDADAIAAAMVAQYPERRHRVAMVGSSNGAGVHLAAALDAPWLPQTYFIPVRRSGIHPDEPLEDLEWGREPARRLLDANPDLQLHHMHDPNQDRLMVQQLTYFRVKRRRLGAAYEAFLRERLTPGGTIVVVECERRWPVIRVGERHVFQPGAMGGLEPDDYLEGSRAVADYLARYGSHRRQWDMGEPDEDAPEAEWGFEPSLLDDVIAFAARHGFGVLRLRFHDPEDLSPLVADLHRRWYVRRAIHATTLLAESFILLEPHWVLRIGSVPYWAKFGTIPSLERLARYIEASGAWEELLVMLFPHGTEGANFADAPRWRELIERVGGGGFIGVDEDAYPRDFAGLKRYHEDLKQRGPRYPMPEEPLRIADVEEALRAGDGRYPVRLTAEPTTDG